MRTYMLGVNIISSVPSMVVVSLSVNGLILFWFLNRNALMPHTGKYPKPLTASDKSSQHCVSFKKHG